MLLPSVAWPFGAQPRQEGDGAEAAAELVDVWPAEVMEISPVLAEATPTPSRGLSLPKFAWPLGSWRLAEAELAMAAAEEAAASDVDEARVAAAVVEPTPIVIDPAPAAVVAETVHVYDTAQAGWAVDLSEKTEIAVAEVVEPVAIAPGGDYVERGVGLIEAGRDLEAYELFKQATQAEPRSMAAWFWRSRVAQTLDEVVTCLERALAIEPTNVQIAANLEWARQRRDQAKAASKPAREEPRHNPTTVPLSQRRGPKTGPGASPGQRVGAPHPRRCRRGRRPARRGLAARRRAGRHHDVGRRCRGPAGRAADADLAGLQSLIELPRVGGYDPSTALPFMIGFLAVFVAAGVMHGERWTLLWAPALGLASAWLWAGGSGMLPSPFVLATCALVVVGGLLALRADGGAREPI